MKADVAVGAIEERVVLFIVGAEASSTGSFEYSFGILPRFFAFLFFHELFKIFFLRNRFNIGINPSILLDRIQVAEIVIIIDLFIANSFPKVFM